MKKINLKYITVFTLTILLFSISCKKHLIENPKTVFTIEYLKTPAGLQSGTYALYSGMRYLYGPQGAILTSNSGTDEWTLGDQGVNSGQGLGAYTLNSTNGDILTPWNRSFNNINLANGILQFGPDVQMTASTKNTILAETHFLRAMYYFILVQQFGKVPVDLGSGDFQFNQNPFQGFNRLDPDLLKKNYQLIIDDFTYAAANLPATRPTGAFNLSKAAAYHFLAKAYLFRGYSAVKEPNDFKASWDASKYVIDNQTTLGTGLLADYGDVHKEGNDYNREILYSIERIPGNPFDNEVNDVSNEFAGKGNQMCNFFNPNYQNNVSINGAFPCDRVLQYMRPLRQLCPNQWLYDTAFADKTNDSRYENTFRIAWLATNNNCAASGVFTGDTAYYLTPTKAFADSLRLLGTKKYRIIDPTQFYLPSRTALHIYPAIKKFDDNRRAVPNDGSGRPIAVAKLSEVYLEAAEAAILDGRPGDALTLMKALRRRAAFRPNISAALLAARQANMENITNADMNIDFIMTERSRELCGENLRWADLACRNLLIPYVKNRNRNLIAANNLQPFHNLRPIPQSQLDASVAITNPQQYQNTGY